MYQLFKHGKDNLLEQDITKNNIVTICDFATKLVLNNAWIKEFKSINAEIIQQELGNKDGGFNKTRVISLIQLDKKVSKGNERGGI